MFLKIPNRRSLLGVMHTLAKTIFVPPMKGIKSGKVLLYKTYGEPDRVLECVQQQLREPDEYEILVQMCSAPIHPSDINTIQGVYPIKPKLPAVAGNEGVGRVIKLGSKVIGLSLDDLVIPSVVSSGTWRTHLCGNASNFYRIPHNMPTSHAAVFRTNPATALRMLRDFVDLKPTKDVLIQNGSTSSVGIYVIQLAKLAGVKTINLFRSRDSVEQTEETRQLLMDYGATWALTDSEFTNRDNHMANECKSAGPICLALNCLGGKPAIVLLKALSHGGTLVSYGGMTRHAMTVPVGPLIFQDIRLRGFWMSAWIQREPITKRDAMFYELSNYFSTGEIRPSPFIEVPFDDWLRGVQISEFDDDKPTEVRKKVILTME